MSSFSLEKASEWNEDEHPRWDAAADDSQGGQFRSADGASTQVSAASRQPKASRTLNPGVPVVLPDGSKIPDANSPTGFMMSPVADLATVADAGRQVGEQLRQTDLSEMGGLLQFAWELHRYLDHGGIFDYQREGNVFAGYTNFRQFDAVSNFNVGLFCQQAGLSLDETLRTSGLFARLFSSNARPDLPYGLHDRTYQYTVKGYKAGESGMFDLHIKSH